jgi:hypothetical protein
MRLMPSADRRTISSAKRPSVATLSVSMLISRSDPPVSPHVAQKMHAAAHGTMQFGWASIRGGIKADTGVCSPLRLAVLTWL